MPNEILLCVDRLLGFISSISFVVNLHYRKYISIVPVILIFRYLQEILTSAGILASNAEKYPLGDIVAAITKAVGATPEVVCKKGAVQELRICFTKEFKVHNFSLWNQVPHRCLRKQTMTITTKLSPKLLGLSTWILSFLKSYRILPFIQIYIFLFSLGGVGGGGGWG